MTYIAKFYKNGKEVAERLISANDKMQAFDKSQKLIQNEILLNNLKPTAILIIQ